MRRFRARGFTLLELMVVIVIIGLLVALATPQMVERIRENRTTGVSQDIARLYINARARAMGRGAPQLIRYDKAATPWYQHLEAIDANVADQCRIGAPPQLVSCNDLGAWVVASAPQPGVTIRLLQSYSPQRSDFPVDVNLLDDQGAGKTQYDVCFSPSGRVQWRFGGAGQFAAPTGVAKFLVQRQKQLPLTGPIGVMRLVAIPPTGVARTFL